MPTPGRIRLPTKTAEALSINPAVDVDCCAVDVPVDELVARLDELESARLAARLPLPGWEGVFPPPDSGWTTVFHDGGFFFVRDIVLEAVTDGTLDGLMAAAARSRQHSHSPRSATPAILLAFLLFLPHTLLLGLLRWPARPGSPYTFGQALVGGVAFFSMIVGGIALVTGHWLLLAACAYGWVGAKVLEGIARANGYYF